MLLQSHSGYIELLPALPDAWPDGNVEGLKARGNIELDIYWKDGMLENIKVYAQQSGDYQFKYQDDVLKLSLEEGEVRMITPKVFQ